MSHPSQQTMWSYATGQLAAGRRARIREHAGDCAACRSELHRAIAATRALSGTSEDVPTRAELEAWGEELLARRAGRGRAPARRYVLALAGASAVAALLLVLPREHESLGDLASRGGRVDARIHVRVLCVSAEGRVQIEEATNGCGVGSFLKLLVGNNRSPRHRMAVLLASDGAVEPVYPAAFGDALLPLPRSIAPLPGSKIIPRHIGDELRIVVLAVDDDAFDAADPLLSWARTARPGQYPDLSGRADAVVVAVDVIGDEP